MTRIYLIRHAEAEGNLYRRIHGQYDSKITCGGRRQIQALARRFAGERIDACYSSDLIRTRVTAQAIWMPKGLPLRCDPRFREVRLGVWEDIPFGQLEQEETEALRQFVTDPRSWHVEGAETFSAYSQRFLDALNEAARRHDGGTIAVVSHGCVIRAVQQRLFFPSEPMERTGHCDNTGVSLLEYEDGSFRLIYLNDNSHLPPKLSTFARQNWWREDTGKKDHNLWFRPLQGGADWYDACRSEASGISGAAFSAPAVPASGAAWTVLLDRKPIGGLLLDPGSGAKEGIGRIRFLYLCPELRGCGLGIQLVGQAVSIFRKLGRTRLHMEVPLQSGHAAAFCRKYGFTETGSSGPESLWTDMELNIDTAEDLAPELAAAH